jgi:hypothetical protein
MTLAKDERRQDLFPRKPDSRGITATYRGASHAVGRPGPVGPMRLPRL